MISRVAIAAEDPSDPRQMGALLERLHLLRSILPGMATEVAIARKEAARLRQENGRLQSRVRQFEAQRTGRATLRDLGPDRAEGLYSDTRPYVGFPAAPTQSAPRPEAA